MGQLLSFEKERRRLRKAAAKVGNRHGQVRSVRGNEYPAASGCLGRTFEPIGDIAARVLLKFPR